MVLVDQTAVPLTLPAIMRHYDNGSQSAQWVLSGSLVALAAALGTMGGIAAMAGAAGPVIGGVLTATLGWQSVFLVNVPLAAVAAVITRVAIPRDTPSARRAPIDLPGAGLLAIMITAFIVGLAQSQNWGWASPAVWGLLLLAIAAAGLFIVVERHRSQPWWTFSSSADHLTTALRSSAKASPEPPKWASALSCRCCSFSISA